MQSPTFSKRFRPPHARVAYFDHTRGRRTGFGGCTRCLTRSGTGHQQRPLAKCTWRFPKVAAAQIQSTNVERNRSRHRGLSYRLDAARPCHYGRLDVPGILRARRDPDLRHILQPRWSWGPLSVRGTALAKHNVDPNAPEQRISKAEIMDDTVLDQSLMERIPATLSERILSDCDDRRIRHFIHFRHDSTGTRKLFFVSTSARRSEGRYCAQPALAGGDPSPKTPKTSKAASPPVTLEHILSRKMLSSTSTVKDKQTVSGVRSLIP